MKGLSFPNRYVRFSMCLSETDEVHPNFPPGKFVPDTKPGLKQHPARPSWRLQPLAMREGASHLRVFVELCTPRPGGVGSISLFCSKTTALGCLRGLKVTNQQNKSDLEQEEHAGSVIITWVVRVWKTDGEVRPSCQVLSE